MARSGIPDEVGTHALIARFAMGGAPARHVLKHGKIVSDPSNWQNRPGYRLFQGRRNTSNTGYDNTGNRIE